MKKIFLLITICVIILSMCSCSEQQDPIIGEWQTTYIKYDGEYSESDLFGFEFYEDNTGTLYFNDFSEKTFEIEWVKDTNYDDDNAYIIELASGEKMYAGLGSEGNSEVYDTMAIVISDESTVILEKVY